jgi:hypothetical protein
MQNIAADCSKCFALCCTALSFERGSQFGHDKPAGQPCQYLAGDFRCSIHARREDLGYDGCEAFDCLGAGQRASALFAAENWQRDPAIARRLYASFSILLRLQEMRQALITAGELDLPPTLEGERREILGAIGAIADAQDEAALPQAANALANAKNFLAKLKTIVQR